MVTHPTQLSKLSRLVPALEHSEVDHRVITGIHFDSRKVQPGDIFVAVSGGNVDGHMYIQDAIQRGAIAVVGTQGIVGLPVPYLQVPNSRYTLAVFSAALYGFPANQLTMIGVTGTDGKTTTSNLIYHLLRSTGIPVGMITTVNAVIGGEEINTGFHVTTPEAPEIQKYLRLMLDRGLTTVVLEATSHGLDQFRVGACAFDIGVITNITHEHLDYHQTYPAYREAKGRLFRMIDEAPPKAHHPPHAAVLNKDDSSYQYLDSIISAQVITYSLFQEADIMARNIQFGEFGMGFSVKLSEKGRSLKFPVQTRLVGEFNVSNILAAIGVGRFLFDIEIGLFQRELLSFPGVPGRMEKIVPGGDPGQEPNFIAIVDFAHTPNALKRSLETARKMTHGRVIAVFGSAGLRDREKRRLMAEISAQYADLTILTAEDPRTESLSRILEEMVIGMQAQGGIEGKTFWRIPDRGEAIQFAINQARDGDLVIACGKGHEQSMCFGEIEYPWDDRLAMRAALAERLGLSGPHMPYLPTQDQS